MRTDRLVAALNAEHQSAFRAAAVAEWGHVANASAHGFECEAGRHEERAWHFARRAEGERRLWFRMVRRHRLVGHGVATRPLAPRPLTLGPWWRLTTGVDLAPVEGWDTGRPCWHGWAMPYATREALLEILDRQAIADDDNPLVVDPMFREAADGRAFVYEPGAGEIPPVRLEPALQAPDGRPLFDLGDLGLCWSWQGPPGSPPTAGEPPAPIPALGVARPPPVG